MMAHVAVLTRMPRKLDALDYAVPDSMTVSRGDLVLVPLRAAIVRGVVLTVRETGVHKAKSVQEVIEREAFSDEWLRVMEETARELVQSISTVLWSAIADSPKRAKAVVPTQDEVAPYGILQEEADYVKRAVSMVRNNKNAFVGASDLVQAAAIIEATIRQQPGKYLVLVPHSHDGILLSRALRSSMPNTFFDAGFGVGETAGILEAWRTNNIQLFVTTRLGVLECPKQVRGIFIVRSGSSEHAQYDRNPRYDAREIAWKYHTRLGVPLFHLDAAPRVVDLLRMRAVLTTQGKEHTVIGLEEEAKRGVRGLLTEPLVEVIKTALQSGKNVLLSYNRKAEGTQEVAKRLMEIFPEVPILRTEKGHATDVPDKRPSICLVTQYYFESVFDPFHPPNLGCVADLMADIGMTDTHPGAGERAIIRLMELAGVAKRCRAELVLQAWDATRIRRILHDPIRALQEEQTIEKTYAYPPYGKLIRIFYRGQDAMENLQELAHLLKGMCVTRGPFGKGRPCIEISVKELTDDLHDILKNLKDAYIIEVNPEKSL